MRSWVLALLFCTGVVRVPFAQTNVDSLLQLFESDPDDIERVKACIELSKYYLRVDLNQARHYAEQSDALVTRDSLQVHTNDQIAKYFFYSGKVDSAKYYFDKARQVASGFGYDHLHATIGLSVGAA
ncbi:MAG: hypothetical protein AAFR14_00420, partial [Bacteroidota bacterium]